MIEEKIPDVTLANLYPVCSICVGWISTSWYLIDEIISVGGASMDTFLLGFLMSSENLQVEKSVLKKIDKKQHLLGYIGIAMSIELSVCPCVFVFINLISAFYFEKTTPKVFTLTNSLYYYNFCDFCLHRT